MPEYSYLPGVLEQEREKHAFEQKQAIERSTLLIEQEEKLLNKRIFERDGYRPTDIFFSRGAQYSAIHIMYVKRDQFGYHYRIYIPTINGMITYEQIIQNSPIPYQGKQYNAEKHGQYRFAKP